VLFSDGRPFFSREAQFVRIRNGAKQLSPSNFNEVVKQSQNKMFWGSFYFSEVGSIMPIGGMINLDRCIDAIERKVIPDMRRTFTDGGKIFQQDLSSCPSSKKLMMIFRKQKIEVLDWRGNSPNHKPIENFWSIIKSRLQKFHRNTMTKPS